MTIRAIIPPLKLFEAFLLYLFQFEPNITSLVVFSSKFTIKTSLSMIEIALCKSYKIFFGNDKKIKKNPEEKKKKRIKYSKKFN